MPIPTQPMKPGTRAISAPIARLRCFTSSASASERTSIHVILSAPGTLVLEERNRTDVPNAKRSDVCRLNCDLNAELLEEGPVVEVALDREQS
jgi:hypothetical protein